MMDQKIGISRETLKLELGCIVLRESSHFINSEDMRLLDAFVNQSKLAEYGNPYRHARGFIQTSNRSSFQAWINPLRSVCVGCIAMLLFIAGQCLVWSVCSTAFIFENASLCAANCQLFWCACAVILLLLQHALNESLQIKERILRRQATTTSMK
jgi:hypothetical protein